MYNLQLKIMRNAARCNNRDDLLNHLQFEPISVSVSVFSEVYLELSRLFVMDLFEKIAERR